MALWESRQNRQREQICHRKNPHLAKPNNQGSLWAKSKWAPLASPAKGMLLKEQEVYWRQEKEPKAILEVRLEEQASREQGGAGGQRGRQ